ncbi:phosphatase [Babesia caballi]|uniref:Phosphatase n=1 Tax=Babesia caballi TaxID=5871 RepID=A0AAV4LLY8_BABCB|nr:phosphatase [Babesia caballi]
MQRRRFSYLVGVALQLLLTVEERHVGGCDAGAQLEHPVHALVYDFLHRVRVDAHSEVDALMGGVVHEPQYQGLLPPHPLLEALEEHLVVVSPPPDGELRNLQHPPLVQPLVVANAVEPALVVGLDPARELAVPRHHGRHVLVFQVPLEVVDDVDGVVVGYLAAEPRSDAVAAVDEHHGDGGDVVEGLDGLPLLVLVLQHAVVLLHENEPRDGHQLRENVTRRRGVLAALLAAAKLSAGLQNVDRGLAVVVRRVLRDVARQLGHLALRHQVPLEAPEEHLPLPRFPPVHHRGDAALRVVYRELDELLVDEVGVPQALDGVVDGRAVLVALHPHLAVVHPLLVEGHVDAVVVDVVLVGEVDEVPPDVGEVLLELLVGGGPETFVVLDLPAGQVGGVDPLGVVLHREEGQDGVALGRLDDGRDKLPDEPLVLDHLRPEVVQQVDHEPLDVRPVVVLIRHDHDRAVPEPLGRRLLLFGNVEPHHLEYVLYFRVLH